LIEVEVGDLKNVSGDIAELLGERLRVEVMVKGKTLIVPEEAHGRRFGVKDVKLQVKHVLHHLGFSEEYRALTEHHRVRIVKIQEKARPMERKGSVPPPSKSLPYFFPG